MSSGPTSVLLSLGANLGNRVLNLRRSVDLLGSSVRVILLSSIYETAAMGTIPDAPDYLNLVLAGTTHLPAHALLRATQTIEEKLGRIRTVPDAPRPIDIDIVLFGAVLMRTRALNLPHPRFGQREFVLAPVRELGLEWIDPRQGIPLMRMHGEGRVRRIGPLFAA